MSETKLNELFEALASFQQACPAIKKTKTANVRMKNGGTFQYSYADLGDILEAIKESLGKCGLAATQLIYGSELITVLAHKSGQNLESRMPLQFTGDWQTYGAAITYARRYALSAILGIAPEEDVDASTVQGSTPTRRDEAQRSSEVARKDEPQRSSGSSSRPASEKQIGFIFKLLEGHTHDERHEVVSKILKREITSFKDLTSTEASAIIEQLKNGSQQPRQPQPQPAQAYRDEPPPFDDDDIPF